MGRLGGITAARLYSKNLRRQNRGRSPLTSGTRDGMLERFHQQLERDIRDDLSGIAFFESANGFDSYFHHYYHNWLDDGRRLQRTRNGALARRCLIPSFVERLKHQAGPRPIVLDVGCGFASDTLLLAWLGCEVIGVDPDARKIAVCRHRARQWRDFLGAEATEPSFLVGRIEDIDELRPASFDGVFSSECLHHCEPVESTLLAMRTLVKDSGRVLALESNGACPANEIVLLRSRDRKSRRTLNREVDGRFWLYGNENIRTARRWADLFRECGFATESIVYSRHLASEMTGSLRHDRMLGVLPGARWMTLHVTFELTPSQTTYSQAAPSPGATP